MYGYRYTPTGHVFDLPGYSLDKAVALVVDKRRAQATRAHSPVDGPMVTVELVSDTTGVWRAVALPLPGERPAAPEPPAPTTSQGPGPLGVLHVPGTRRKIGNRK